MSIDINSIGISSLDAIPATQATSSRAGSAFDAGSASVDARDAAVSVELGSAPGAVPDEVTAAVRAASRAYDRLEGSGRHVSFTQEPETGSVVIEMHGESGGARTLSGGDLLALTEGSAD